MGDCKMQPVSPSVYCYYHDKLQTGAIQTLLAGNTDNWHEVSPSLSYPVWPLPRKGYDLARVREVAA